MPCDLTGPATTGIGLLNYAIFLIAALLLAFGLREVWRYRTARQ